jgi:hypothetical protein
MGWKGTVRVIGAAIRAAERDAKRRQRELRIKRVRSQFPLILEIIVL